MAWVEGQQRKNKKPYTNIDLAAVKGSLEDKDAKLWLANFFKENLTVLVRILTGIDLLPFQSMMIKAMMNTDYFLAILSRGGGKSFLAALFLVAYASINQGVKIGILANSFRQSRLLMQKILDLRNEPKAKLLNQCITNVSLKNDEWTIEIGRSKLIALPLGDGSKLRGYRFQVMVVDELLLMSEKILNEVVLPFLAVVTNPTERKKVREAEDKLVAQGKMKDEERKVWNNNKFIGLSSASFKFDYLFKIYKQYEDSILTNNNPKARYSIFHMSCDSLPTELYDGAMITKLKNEMSEAQYSREILSQFTDDSSGYYKMSKMKSCTYPDGEGQSVEAVGEIGSEYLISCDSSWSESEGSDDFVFHVIKYYKETGLGILVHTYAIPGAPMKEHIKYFHFLLTHFNVVGIVMDYNGGIQFLSAANESELFKNSKIEIKTIDVDIEDPTNYNEDILAVRNLYNLTDKRICIQRKPSSNFIRQGNESLQAAFDHKRFMFAGMAMDGDFQDQISKKIPVKELRFLRQEAAIEKTTVDFVENLRDNIEMTKTQCALIEVSTTPQGTQTFDLPTNLKRQRGANKARKDAFSALVLGNWFLGIYNDMLKMPVTETQITFTPVLI